jgi:hypothetical protein
MYLFPIRHHSLMKTPQFIFVDRSSLTYSVTSLTRFFLYPGMRPAEDSIDYLGLHYDTYLPIFTRGIAIF